MKIEAIHHFHDKATSRAWSEEWQPNEHKLKLFNNISDNLPQKETINVIELGIGPG